MKVVSNETDHGTLIISPFEKQDIDAQLSYIYDSPKDFLISIGFSPETFLPRDEQRKVLEEKLDKGDFKKAVARLNGKTIAGIYLDERLEEPRGHFHIFSSELRGLGLGKPILKTALKELMTYNQIDSLFLEPKIDNMRINGLLKKCGFEFLGESFFQGPNVKGFKSNKYLVRLKDL